jgi:hypothetical protein
MKAELKEENQVASERVNILRSGLTESRYQISQFQEENKALQSLIQMVMPHSSRKITKAI